MLKIFIIILVFIIGIISQYLLTRYLKTHKVNQKIDDEIKFNQKNEIKIQNILNKTITERVKLLETMKYNEWLEYNQKNNFVKIDGYKFPIIIYQLIIYNTDDFKNSSFVNKVHHIEKFINFTWNDVIKEVSNYLVFNKNDPNKNLLSDSYYISKKENDIVLFKYYWYDHDNHVSIKKKTSSKYWSKDNISGIISIGYTYDIDIQKYYNYNFLENYIFRFINISIFVISILIYVLNKNFYTSLLFIIISNIFLIIYFKQTGEISSPEVELDKIRNINSGVLGISFLTSVNVYVLSNLNKYENKIFYQSSVVFIFSIIFLLIATYKTTNYTDVDDLIQIRLTKQLAFNYAVLLNLFIIINYLLFVTKNFKNDKSKN